MANAHVPPGFSHVENVSNALYNIRHPAANATLWDPNFRLKLASQHLKSPNLLTPSGTGRALMAYSGQTPVDSKFEYGMFSDNYTSSDAAKRDFAATLKRVHSVGTQNARTNMLPPLLVTYAGKIDMFLAISVIDGGELKPVREGATPELMLNFHHLSGVINPVLINVSAENYKNVELAVTALYGMMTHDKTPLTVAQFARLYDHFRLELLRGIDAFQGNR